MSAVDLGPRAAREQSAGLVAEDLDDEALVERFALALWSCLTEPGDGVAGRLVAAVGAAAALRVALGTDRAAPAAADLTPAQLAQ
ncbi:MAG: DNA-protecting protein DprA, partial [Microbacterium sp.]